MKNKIKSVILVSACLFIAVSAALTVYGGVTRGAGEGQVGENMTGAGYFKAFTVDSNILCAVASLATAVFAVPVMLGKRERIPEWAAVLQYVGSVAVGLTFLTVVLFLGPVYAGSRGFLFMFSGDMFLFHLLNPLLSVACSVFLVDGEIRRRDNFLALVPTTLYGSVYCAMVVSGKWSDFYFFTFGGHFYLIPAVFAVMLAVTYLIGLLIRVCREKTQRAQA
ncbi:MAG: hypothetical protein IKS28_02060 [Clostridia bacterium]|nr:hypothetical protein [Clostridia bacterium]